MKNLLLTLSVFTLMSFESRGQQFWASVQGGQNVDETLAIDTDQDGNSYTTGYFSSVASISGVNLTSSGLTDVFFVKNNAAGEVIWRAKAGGPMSDRGLAVSADANGNLIVCGFYKGSIDFGNGVTLNAIDNSQDAFVAKYNVSGQAVWARGGGSGGNSDRANGVATDALGNIYLTGQFSGEAIFDGTTITSEGNTSDIYTAKYDGAGNLLWIKIGTGEGANSGQGIAASASGEVYVTGTFSDTIAFDNVYNNPIINALFLIKYSTAGDEVWFRYAGGSNQSASYAIAETEGQVYITGDCGPTLTFFNTNLFPVINNDYDNAVFLAKFNASGAYQWGRAYGSNSLLGARGLACSADKVVMTGWFECTFDSLSGIYGERIFRSFGFRDVFLIALNDEGEWGYAHHGGSALNDEGRGLSIPPDGYEIMVGSFTIQSNFSGGCFIMPTQTTGTLTGVSYSNLGNETFCNIGNYGDYTCIAQSEAYGANGFMYKGFDPETPPVDLYAISLIDDCDFSVPSAQIYSNNTGEVNSINGSDTLVVCYPDYLLVNTFMNLSPFPNNYYSYIWNDNQSIDAAFTGEVSVQVSRPDGCYTLQDTVWVIAPEKPLRPAISDSWGINDSTLAPISIHLCPGDSIILSAQYLPSLEFEWSAGSGSDFVTGDSVWAFNQGQYFATVTDSIGCTSYTLIHLSKSTTPLDTISPVIEFYDGNNMVEDSVAICSNDKILVYHLESISGQYLNEGNTSDYLIEYFVNGVYAGETENDWFYINSPTTGWYIVETETTYLDTLCFDNPELYYAVDSIYIEKLPLPSPILQLFGPQIVCAGDQYVITVNSNGTPQYYFEVDSITSSGDSLFTSETGYLTASVTLTNSFGCSKTTSAFINVNSVTTPIIYTFPAEAVICPGASVTLSTASPGTINWVGPSGSAGTGSSITVTEPGLYYAEVEFYEGCNLVSNTAQVSGYATPYITAWPPSICINDGEVTLTVVATNPTSITWMAPLTGGGAQQVITEPGVYSAQVESCNVISEITITVGYSQSEVSITVIDTIPACVGDTIHLQASGGFMEYDWSNDQTGQDIFVTTDGAVTVAALDVLGCYVVADSVSFSFEDIPAPVVEFDLPCFGEDIILQAGSAYQSSWIFENDTISTINYVLDGPIDTSFVSVFLFSEWCVGPTVNLDIVPRPLPPTPIVSTSSPACTGQPLSLWVLEIDTALVYNWQTADGSVLSGGPEQGYTIDSISDAGTYLSWATLDGCNSDTVAVSVDVFVTEQVILPADTVLCSSGDLTIAPFGGTFISYLWQDGSADSIFVASATGSYFVMASDLNNCPSYNDMQVTFVSCLVVIPNIITPNGDGLNDTWIIDIFEPKMLSAKVFDRWGKTVYDSSKSDHSWEGRYQITGENCSSGQYFYVVEGLGYLDQDIRGTGIIQIVRD